MVGYSHKKSRLNRLCFQSSFDTMKLHTGRMEWSYLIEKISQNNNMEMYEHLRTTQK